MKRLLALSTIMILIVLSYAMAQAATQPSGIAGNVTVTNTSANPVPVTGNVNINVTNTSVPVSNTPASPLYIKESQTVQLLSTTTFSVPDNAWITVADNVDVSKCATIQFRIITEGSAQIGACRFYDPDVSTDRFFTYFPGEIGDTVVNAFMDTPGTHLTIWCAGQAEGTADAALYCR